VAVREPACSEHDGGGLDEVNGGCGDDSGSSEQRCGNDGLTAAMAEAPVSCGSAMRRSSVP